MASNLKVDIVRPTATNGALSLKGDSGGSATTNGVTINSSGNTSITGTTTVSQLNADNLRLDGNTLSSTNADGDVTLTPNGAGNVTISGDAGIRKGVSSATLSIWAGATQKGGQIDLVGGGALTDAGSISFRTGTGGSSATQPVAMSIDSDGNVGIGNLNLEGNTLSSTNTDGDVTLTPNGAGNVTISGDAGIRKGVSSATLSIWAGATQKGGQIDLVGGGALTDAGSISFRTGTGGSSATQPVAMTIDSDGNVGAAKFTDLDGTGAPDFPNGLTNNNSPVYSRSNILDTVSQSSGVPTGGIIERGSNSNGEYVKFADGTMICSHNTSSTQAVTSSFAGGYISGSNLWTFPVQFTSEPSCFASGKLTSRRTTIMDNYTSTTAYSYYHQSSSSQASATADVYLFAFGRWY